jgi:lipopolysaccharide transport system ATP-binding protein
MSTDKIAIRVSHLGKKYTIGGPQEKYLTFRDAIVNSVKAPFRRFSSHEPPQEFWALKDVSFDVEQGEVVGIIGRNGAGKSTLLKILSRITSPSEGTVDLYGRVGSLLEVGTGFHPELTGRENIFLSGSILGMKRREIDAKLDEIVKFSEIEKFLDTPVKRYSSGMYVRLAFAVAAHMDTEILLVDEVLAVGDAQFQKKCLGKMKEISGEGRTVMFVSHSMPTIENLCKRVLWIESGSILEDGKSKSVVADYINKTYEINDRHNGKHLILCQRKIGEYQNLGNRRGTGEIQFTFCNIVSDDRKEIKNYLMGDTLHFEVGFTAYRDIENVIFTFGIVDSLTQVFVTNWFNYQNPQTFLKGEKGTFFINLPNNQLRVRNYYLYLGMIGNGDVPYDIWDGTGTEFTINYPSDVSNLPFPVGRDTALISIPVIVNIQRT